MHPIRLRTPLICLLFAGVFLGWGQAQSLSSLLEEEEPFYENYGEKAYAREVVQSISEPYYDLFGNHITDGFFVYHLYKSDDKYSKTIDAEFDSTALSRNNEVWKSSFYSNFTNLVMTRDAVGGLKSTILVGDQIKTKFTPFTFNRLNYKGIRWDIWSSGMKFTGLFSRGRPSAVAFRDQNVEARVDYPLIDGSFVNYGSGSTTPTSALGDSADYSNKSPYGDYDLLLAFHAENNLANVLQYGVSYVNHHHSDIKKGEKLNGDIPDGFIPEEIHFELYDMTDDRLDDAGVFVDNNFLMTVTKTDGSQIANVQPRNVFTIDLSDSTIYGISLPRTQNGIAPVIVTFNPQTPSTGTIIPKGDIQRVQFTYAVAGNYVVFVSTDRFVNLRIDANIDRSEDEFGEDIVEYDEPYSRGIREIFDENEPIYGRKAATYFGEYIARSPKPTFLTRPEFDAQVTNYRGGSTVLPANYRAYSYEFSIDVNSITYGANFKGKLFGVNFSGEVATSIRDRKYPGPDNKVSSYETLRHNLLQFKADRNITNMLNFGGEFYRIDPRYEPNLRSLQPSRFMSQTKWAYPYIGSSHSQSYDYLVNPKPLSNDWKALDDNEDQDLYVENDRRHYPSNISDGDEGSFTLDGLVKAPYIGQKGPAETVKLPTNMFRIYDDEDGVISSRFDGNKNGTVDYKEDFLLFYKDPPVFELGNDLNFNGVYDYEDDDILPDLFRDNGTVFFLPHTITSNTFVTHGLQGLEGRLRVVPTPSLELNVGVRLENAINMNFTESDPLLSEDKGSADGGKASVFYGTGMLKVVRRAQGIEYFLGDEVYQVKDAIRNDAIVTEGEGDYLYITDEMRYRNALINNLVCGIAYLNIRDFEAAANLMMGLEMHKGIADKKFYNTKVRHYLTETREDSVAYESFWEASPARTIAKSVLVTRVGYTKRWNLEYEGWRSAFNLFNRVEVIPQFKLSYEFKRNLKTGGDRDPRTKAGFRNPQLLGSDDLAEYKNEWSEFDANTEDLLLSVPILRVDFQIAERTKLQTGIQWKRSFDRITETNSSLKTSQVVQVISRDSYAGYNVAIMFGVKINDYLADTNMYDRYLNTGFQHNKHNSQVFAKVYAGL